MGTISIKKRHSIRKDEIAEIMANLRMHIGPAEEMYRSDQIEKVDTNSPFTLFLIHKQPFLMKYENWVFPTIRGAIVYPISQRRITVDTGAIPFVINGADVMRPGIISISDDVKEGAPVTIVEDGHKKPIAVAVALFGYQEIKQQVKGKMCRTIHYVGDSLWKLEL